MIGARPAGFWIRGVAAALDFAVFLLVKLSFDVLGLRIWGLEAGSSAEFVSALWVCVVLFAAVYTIALHALFGQTIGKMLVGVRVVTGDDGAPPALGASVLRWVAYFASLATLGLGYVMAGLRQDKRALHDLIAGTRVERMVGRSAPREAQVEPPATA